MAAVIALTSLERREMNFYPVLPVSQVQAAGFTDLSGRMYDARYPSEETEAQKG